MHNSWAQYFPQTFRTVDKSFLKKATSTIKINVDYIQGELILCCGFCPRTTNVHCHYNSITGIIPCLNGQHLSHGFGAHIENELRLYKMPTGFCFLRCGECGLITTCNQDRYELCCNCWISWKNNLDELTSDVSISLNSEEEDEEPLSPFEAESPQYSPESPRYATIGSPDYVPSSPQHATFNTPKSPYQPK